ncbi:hypothetical protein NDU88_005208 [Pleurodeles waltl]|uniref:Uncharacterized protein n=1 Tax=Pleurodeles waltl TaxID=8319 RepID=A0AAV7L3Q7_PLEWA|nr:hypothetical protein NDU88_005208 [Pleurodeles waltl]
MKKPLSGGEEQRQRRSRRKSLVKTADPGELCERAATLQEKRGHSRYGVRNEGKQAGGKERREVGRKGALYGEHWGKRGENGMRDPRHKKTQKRIE